MRIKNAALISIATFFVVTPVVLAQEAPQTLEFEAAPIHSEMTTQVMPEVVNEATEPAAPRIISAPVAEPQATFRETVMQKRMDALTTSQTSREQFREQLQTISDAQVVSVVQRLDDNFLSINNTSTDRWITALEQMTDMVDRAGSQAADLEESGTNTVALSMAITRAETALATAQTAVSNQAGKSYVVTITTEAALPANVRTVALQFGSDIRSTYATVSSAKQAVVQVMQALASAQEVPVTQVPQATNSAETME